MNRSILSRVSRPALVLLPAVVLVALGVWRFFGSDGGVGETSPIQNERTPVEGAVVAPESHALPSAGEPSRKGAQSSRQRLLAAAETLDERWLDDPATTSTPRRVRLSRLSDDAERPVRLIERLSIDPATGSLRILGAEVMRADAVLVVVPEGQNATALATRLQAAGFETGPFQSPDAVVSVLLREVSLDAVPEALARLAATLPDLLAEPDFIRFASQTTSNDFDPTRLWGLEKIEAPAAWTVSTGSPDVVVAVIDSGVVTNHPDLAANLWTNPGEVGGNGLDDDGNGYIDDVHGWNFAASNNSVADTDGHGTHVAGTIGAVGNNGTGVVGVTWAARIMTLRAGNRTFSDAALLNSIRYVILMRQRGVNVVAVNMSLGGEGESVAFQQEVTRALNAGILIVAAAGNERSNNDLVPVYPASYTGDGIIAVASSNQSDSLSVFSHYGATSVDLAAPGTAILSTVLAGGYGRYDGTSMAAPHVAGAVALVAATNPGLSASGIRARILSTVDPVPALVGRVATGGRLNLRRAVAPSLLRPRVTLTCGGAASEVAALDRAGLSLALGATLHAENGQTPAAALAWTMVEGPASVTFSSVNATATTATFPVAGRYRVRVTATAGALQESDELVVAVGDTSVTMTGLGAWWRFDDTGATTLDSSGNGRDGTVIAASRSSTAVLGTSMVFDGSTSRVGFNTPALSQVTIAGWVRATGAGSSIFPRIVHMREGLLFGGFESSQTDDGNLNTLKFALDNGASDVVWHTPRDSFLTGTWYHVAVAYDPSATNAAPVFYIDGVRQVTGTQTSAVTAPFVGAGIGYIGDRGDGGRSWLGQLDELRLYNRVLSSAEVVWMSREVALRALAGGTITSSATVDPFTVSIVFTPAATGLGAPSWVNSTWAAVGGGATFNVTSSTTATASFTAPGTHLVRYDATSVDGVHVARTIAVEVSATPVTREGYYSGTTSDGGIWTMWVRSDGTGTFFSSSNRGSFQRNFTIPTWGIFNFSDRSGTAVSGRILADGSVSGTMAGATSYTGVRTTAGSGDVDPDRDGTYSGWVVDTGVRAAAHIERGRMTIVIEEPGLHRAATGSIGVGGSFALSPASGVSFEGAAAGGRLEADIVLPAAQPREVVLLRDGVNPVRRLANISVRGRVGTGSAVLIPGFVVDGSGTLPVLVRGIGPGLAAFGVAEPLAHPRLTLRQGTTQVSENTGWTVNGQAADIIAANTRTGAFALDPALLDSALTLPLSAVPYTVEVSGADGGTGVALAEIYDARTGSETAGVANLSGRGFVGTEDDLLIGGFVVTGEAPVLVLVRAAGPALADFGVEGTLAHPQLSVLRGSTVLATSGPWGANASAAAVVEAGALVGAFPFAPGSDDAALLLFLPPGPHTAQISGADGGTGVALIEIYRVFGF